MNKLDMRKIYTITIVVLLALIVVLSGFLISENNKVKAVKQGAMSTIYSNMIFMRNNLPILLEDDPQISQTERVQRCFSEMNAAFNTAERLYDEPYNGGFGIIANTFCDTQYITYYDYPIYGIAYDGCVTDNEREYIQSLIAALSELVELAFESDGMSAKDGITYDDVRGSIREFLDSWCSVDNIGSSPISLLEPARVLS